MTPREVAAAIRKGHSLIAEAEGVYLSTRNEPACGCALGAAWVGTSLSIEEYWAGWSVDDRGVKRISRQLGIPFSSGARISHMHSGGTSRLKIANWLDTLEEWPE